MKTIRFGNIIHMRDAPKKGEILSITIRVEGEPITHTIKARKNSSIKSIAKSFNKFFKKYNSPITFKSK